MKLIISAVLMVAVVFVVSVSPATFTSTASDGTVLTIDITPQLFRKPSGKSEIRIPGVWTYAKGNISLKNGIIYSSSWTDYAKDANNLYENDIAHGASMAVLFAPPSAFCPQGAIINAIMEMPASTDVSSLGQNISLTPVSGSVCGDQVLYFSSYAMTYVANAHISGSPTTTTSTSTPVTPPIDLSGSWSGSWTSTVGQVSNGTLSGVMVQSGYSINGAMVIVSSPCFAGSTSITGTLVGGQVSFNGSTLRFTGTVSNGGSVITGTYTINDSVIANCTSDAGKIVLYKK